MSMDEGGPKRCSYHEFETSDVNEWNKHWLAFGPEDCNFQSHYEFGAAPCNKCGEEISFTHLPPHPYAANGSKNISLTCPDCQEKYRGNVQTVKLSPGGSANLTAQMDDKGLITNEAKTTAATEQLAKGAGKSKK